MLRKKHSNSNQQIWKQAPTWSDGKTPH